MSSNSPPPKKKNHLFCYIPTLRVLSTPLLVCRPATSRMLGYLPCPILQLQAKSSVMWLESPRRGRNWSCLLRTHHTGAGPKWPQVPSGITTPLVRLLNQLHRPPGRTRNSLVPLGQLPLVIPVQAESWDPGSLPLSLSHLPNIRPPLLFILPAWVDASDHLLFSSPLLSSRSSLARQFRCPRDHRA